MCGRTALRSLKKLTVKGLYACLCPREFMNIKLQILRFKMAIRQTEVLPVSL
jgi:hypothetical protein